MVGYSLGANSSVFVANKAKYVDVIVALQPSVFSWDPPVRGKVGRMIEIYNPNPLMTFGGMGSKKLEGANIEYIANNDSHPGAQFSSQFRNLVKGEIAKFTAENRVEIAQANAPKPTRARSAAACFGARLCGRAAGASAERGGRKGAAGDRGRQSTAADEASQTGGRYRAEPAPRAAARLEVGPADRHRR